jgi:deoxyribose-phosphate aldolase
MAQQSIDYADVRKCNTTSCKAGGVRTYDEAVEMIKLGVKRIGTSGASLRMEEIQMWDTNFTIKSNMKRVCSL